MTPPPDAALPHDPFRQSDMHRAAVARQRFFEEGVRPTGLVSEAVIQSWSRCLHARLEPQRCPEFNPVTRSRIHAVLGRHHALLEAARDEMARLQEALAGTASIAFLLDAEGVVMQTTQGDTAAGQHLLPLAARVGVSLSEDSIGTNAPGITARMGVPCVVMGAEHFAAPVQRMYCAAAPIRDASGAVAAVLDLSSEQRPFGFDAAAVVGLYASAIENRLLVAQAGEQLVVSLQLDAALLDSAWAALLGVNGQGGIDWMNAAAARLLGDAAAGHLAQPAVASIEAQLGCSLDTLLQIAHQGHPRRLRLANGLTVWMRARLLAPDGAAVRRWQRGEGAGAQDDAVPAAATADVLQGDTRDHRRGPAEGTAATTRTPWHEGGIRASTAPASCATGIPITAAAGALAESAVGPSEARPATDPAAPSTEPLNAAPATPAGTLRDSEQALIDQTLADCGGNISAAARRLGVSRGLIYRHLQRQPAEASAPGA